MRARELICLAAAAVCWGCKSQHDRETARVQKALSWVSTAGSVAQLWVENRVPARYAERTLDEARTELTSNGEAESALLAATLRDAVHRADRAGVAAPLASLMAHRGSLHAQSDQLESEK
ncbi:MAG TPA: hypothetical protein VJ867_09520 [Gemmatimonadaceae bacterium]|nr:hypothetical protein [Gemmatimonadaceae bacterium]